MSPVAAPADKRFRRAHVKPGRRRRQWQAIARPALKVALLAVALSYGLYRMTAVAAQAHVLQVDRITLRGNERLSRAEVMQLLKGLRGESLVWTDLDAWRKRLLASPWVRDASLRRSLPSTVDVVVAERQPIGVGRINGQMYLIDDRGIVIDLYGPQHADLDLPIVDGLSIRSADDGALADQARAELAARLITSLRARPPIAKRVSQVDVTDLHNAAVILNDDAAVIRLGDDQFLQRLEAYLDLAPALRERVNEIDYVDLRFDDRIYVRPARKQKAEPAVRPSRLAR
jgi:cell division protein FtsQ